MPIEVIRLGTGGVMIAIDGIQSWEGFKQLIQNGSGLYPDLPAEIKKFADEITVGYQLQNYVDDPKNNKVTSDTIEEAFEPDEKVSAKYCEHCGCLSPILATTCNNYRCKRVFKHK